MSTERYRVAVVVFADVEGVDYRDAASGAAMAVRHALNPDRGALPVAHRVPVKHLDRSARVVDVMELGLAAGNGYLWTEPTRRAWRDYGNDFDGPAHVPPTLDAPDPT